MDQEKELESLDKSINRLDQDASKIHVRVFVLTKWITVLTFVMILIGIIQLLVMWPKRTYCVTIKPTIQICEPDYYPFDTNPADTAYKLDKALGQN